MTANERAIGLLVARYRVTTVETLAEARELTTVAARSAITRMLADKLLCVALRLPERTLYQLTPKAASELGVSPSVARPLQAQGIHRRYGILAYCYLGDVRRRLLTAAEFADFYPGLAAARGVDAGQQDFVQMKRADGVEILVQVTLDQGAQRDSILRKCRHILVRAQQIPSFRELVHDKRFRLVVLTATEGKAKQLTDYLGHLEERDLLLTQPVRVEVVPQLLHIPGHIPGGSRCQSQG